MVTPAAPHHRPRRPPRFPSELTLHPPQCCTHTKATPGGGGEGVSGGLWNRVPTPAAPASRGPGTCVQHGTFTTSVFLCSLGTLHAHFYFYRRTNVTLTHVPLPVRGTIFLFPPAPLPHLTAHGSRIHADKLTRIPRVPFSAMCFPPSASQAPPELLGHPLFHGLNQRYVAQPLPPAGSHAAPTSCRRQQATVPL